MMRWPLSLRLGVGFFALGVGPLLLFGIADAAGLIRDPKPNPVGLGLLAFVSFWPAVGLTIFGLFRLAWKALCK